MKNTRFGRLVLLERVDGPHKKYVYWLCQCDCGSLTRKRQDHVKNGRTTSCGCFNAEEARKRSTKHNQCFSSTYVIWQNMKSRCLNPKNKAYHNYGGRGIFVCPEWVNSFEQFLGDMGDRPDGLVLDRINNNDGYYKENCRWVTYSENNRNKRNSIILEHDGTKQSIKTWSEKTGINHGTLTSRLRRNKWTITRLLNEQPFIGKNQTYKVELS